MFGWRRKVGLINPGPIDVQAYDFYKVAPEGVGLVGVTANLDGWSDAEFDRALATVDGAVTQLRARQVHFITHAGIPLVARKGRQFMLDLVQRLSSDAVPGSTALFSAMEALRHLEAQRIALITPYTAEIHGQVETFLAGEGFVAACSVATDTGYGEMAGMSQQAVYDFVVAAIRRAPGAQAAWVPCPHWRIFELAPYLEADIGIPVVSTDAASFWYAFHRLGIGGVTRGFGALMDGLA